MLIVDAHQDLAWNMLTLGRDYNNSVTQTRSVEVGSQAPMYNDDTMLGWLEYQRGQVALLFATLFAAPIRFCSGEWDTQCYADSNQALRLYHTQLDAYERMVDDHVNKFRMIQSRSDLQNLLTEWRQEENQETDKGKDRRTHPVGLVILMEGAEAIHDLGELEEWWNRGVRLIGPAWSGNRFCGGTGEPGPLTKEGHALLAHMEDLGFGLDLSHMDEQAALQAVDIYPGQIVATHSNALALLKGSNSNRHLSDRLIEGILERDGVIGIVLFNAFLKPGWKRGDRREEVQIHHVISQIDYICQLAGDALHVGIGSDFDGGFGLQSVPMGIDNIADLQNLVPLLADKGYSKADISAILGENWITRLERILPPN
jgi:membrane dipeptidase